MRQFFKDAICLCYPKDIQKMFRKTIDFVKNLEMTQTAGDAGSCSSRHYARNAYEN